MKIIRVHNCNRCPYLEERNKWCSNMATKEVKMPNPNSIPEWCPLESVRVEELPPQRKVKVTNENL